MDEAESLELFEQATRGGDPGAWTELFLRFYPVIFTVCVSVLRHRQDAEDAACDTFESIVRYWRSYDPSKARLRTWILAIARNRSIDTARRRRKTRLTFSSRSNDDSTEPWCSHAAAPLRPEDRCLDAVFEDIKAAFPRLTEEQCRVLVMVYWQDLSQVEVARRAGMSEAWVSSQLSRARRILRDSLDDDCETIL